MIHQDIQQIIANASNLYERIHHSDFIEILPELDNKKIKDRFSQWEETIGKGDSEKFKRRIEWEGWTLPQVQKALSHVRWKKDAILPAWAIMLDKIIQSPSHFTMDKLSPLPTQSKKPIPFEDFFFPIIELARQELFLQLKVTSFEESPLNLMTREAYLELERSLLVRLSHISEQTLELEFNKIRPGGYEWLAMMLNNIVNGKNTLR